MQSIATFADVLKFDPSQRRDARGRWTESGGGEDPPPVGPRIGFIGADGKEHVGRKSGGLGGYSEDHTDTARRLLDKDYATALSQAQARGGDYPNAIRLMLEQGAIRYWVRRGELALNFHAGHPKAVTHAIKFLHDNFQDGDRIYLDVERGDTTLGKFFDSLGEANRVIRQQGAYRAFKQEHKFGNTQIQIDPTSSAAATLNAARARISDDDLMADGKDVDPNHVTVRFGLLNDDLDSLRAYIASQLPFEAHVIGTELFPASEHSDGAVPVVALIASPDLRVIEKEIGRHADFKEKSFPVYKPHCTLAYCKPEAAKQYADLYVDGSFIVRSITISHASGVQETIPFGMLVQKRWVESRHQRHPKGTPHGGEFKSILHGPKDALDSILNEERDVNIDRGDVRRFLQLAAEQGEDPSLSHVHIEGMEEFGGRGLGIKRADMPQIPRDHRQRFLEHLEREGIKITQESVDPFSLKPTQKEISARRVGQMLAKYEKGEKVWNPPLVSQDDRLLDGHHHWGLMVAFGLDFPEARIPIVRLHMGTKKALALMHAYMKQYGLERQALDAVKKKDPETGRYVTPFVSFEKQGDEQLRMIASLNSSRLATWGFTAEAEVLGYARYRLTAVLDGRTSKFCRLINGKIFKVPDARKKVIEVLEVQNPDDLKVVQPWPKQTRAALAAFKAMTPEELTALGLHIPPYHPHCRTICRHVEASEGEPMETVPTTPVATDAFHPTTIEDLKELGIDATQEDVDQWNEHVGMSPVELLTKLSGVPPQEVMTRGQGVGSKPIHFEPSGEIGFKVRGETPSGVEFKVGAILDPFTGVYYLTEAALEKGSYAKELAFLKDLLGNLIDIGLDSSATEIALGVAGNAAYYAKLGFLPDELEWESIRKYALTEAATGYLQPVFASLSAEDRLLVQHLLQDRSVQALSTLVDLPFSYQGRTIGEWILGDIKGTWALDLLDADLVEQAKAYLGYGA